MATAAPMGPLRRPREVETGPSDLAQDSGYGDQTPGGAKRQPTSIELLEVVPGQHGPVGVKHARTTCSGLGRVPRSGEPGRSVAARPGPRSKRCCEDHAAQRRLMFATPESGRVDADGVSVYAVLGAHGRIRTCNLLIRRRRERLASASVWSRPRCAADLDRREIGLPDRPRPSAWLHVGDSRTGREARGPDVGAASGVDLAQSLEHVKGCGLSRHVFYSSARP